MTTRELKAAALRRIAARQRKSWDFKDGASVRRAAFMVCKAFGWTWVRF